MSDPLTVYIVYKPTVRRTVPPTNPSIHRRPDSCPVCPPRPKPPFIGSPGLSTPQIRLPRPGRHCGFLPQRQIGRVSRIGRSCPPRSFRGGCRVASSRLLHFAAPAPIRPEWRGRPGAAALLAAKGHGRGLPESPYLSQQATRASAAAGPTRTRHGARAGNERERELPSTAWAGAEHCWDAAGIIGVTGWNAGVPNCWGGGQLDRSAVLFNAEILHIQPAGQPTILCFLAAPQSILISCKREVFTPFSRR